jgi:hypothetical protein
MHKVGRNEPCPCGSGKKYKKCCLRTEEENDFLYRRISQAHHGLVEKVMEFLVHDLKEDIFYEASIDFFQKYLDEEDQETLVQDFGPLFWPWFLFNWELSEWEIRGRKLESLFSPDTTLFEFYLQKKEPRLDELEKAIASGVNRNAYTFLEVERVFQNRGFNARDLLGNKDLYITEHTASNSLKDGDIIFGNPTQVKGYTYLTGSGPIKIPQKMKSWIIDYREELQGGYKTISEGVLRENETETIQTFLELYFSLTKPWSKMTNMDGEALSFRTVYYDIKSPGRAFDALCTLCAHSSRGELISEAEFDEQGRFVGAEFPWSQAVFYGPESRENIVMGHIYINGRSLTVEVNSEEREEEIREEIESLLGEEAKYRVTEVQSCESAMKEAADKRFAEESESEDLMQSPEVQNLLAGKLREHWRGWMDIEVPALGNKTPRQAAQTSEGREKVLSLLRDAENTSPSPGMEDIQKESIREIKEELGL